MTLREGDTVSLDGTEYEVNTVTPRGCGLMPVGTAANYFWFIFKTTEELESLHKNGRLVVGKTDRVEGGEKPCSWHSWQKYVGIREVYHYCTNCNAKRFVDWTSIKDEKEY